MPLLAEDDHVFPGHCGGRDDVVDQTCGQARIPAADLALLAVVHAVPMLRRDPLAPPVEVKLAALLAFFSGQLGITDEVEVRVVPHARERPRQSLNAYPKSARLAVLVRSLKAQQNENGPVGFEDHRCVPTIASASA